MNEIPQNHEETESSWEEIRDVFKSTTDSRPWIAGNLFTKEEIKTFINEPIQEAANHKNLSLKEVQKNIQELKATHTHGS